LTKSSEVHIWLPKWLGTRKNARLLHAHRCTKQCQVVVSNNSFHLQWPFNVSQQ
jgi:hypothetical protein